MKNQDQSLDLFLQNSLKVKTLDDCFYPVFKDVLKYVSKHQKDIVKANILLSRVLDQMIEYQNHSISCQQLIGKNMKEYIRRVDKTIQYKNQIEKIKNDDYGQYNISGLYMTICAYLLLLFIKEVLTQHFLIHFSIDLIVAVFAFVLYTKGVRTHDKLIQRYQISKKPIIIEIIGFITSLFVVLITLKSPFDISFFILVIAYLVSQKIFKKLVS